jgi:hypothetical protein
MAEKSREGLFSRKYQGVEKIWSGPSFIQYHDYRTLLAELPVSRVAKTDQEYSRKFPGNLEYVYGEMLYSLTGFEGYLRDKAWTVEECCVRPICGRNTYILEFDIRYRTREGEEVTRPAAVLRLGETRYIFYTDYYRPM